MAVMGEPTALMRELLAEVQRVQAAARVPIKAGVAGGMIYERALEEIADCQYKADIHFAAHGQGLVSHEAPHLTGKGFPYPGLHEKRPLEAGMVISIETEIWNKAVGFVKLEDTVAVTEHSWEAFGDTARAWVVAGDTV
jgi:Xaa-Pro aminopeptidase